MRMRFADGGFALCLLKPTQEGRVEGVGPVQAEVAGHRVEATEQVSADWHPHGDGIWMSWHGVECRPNYGEGSPFSSSSTRPTVFAPPPVVWRVEYSERGSPV